MKFASQNKLPLKIRTRSAIFKNIDKDYESGSKVAPPTAAGFTVDLALATGASDIALNCIPVTEADLKAGDLFLEFNKEHVQVLVDVRQDRVDIMQGNFPGLDSNRRKYMSRFLLGRWFRATNSGNRESFLYLGTPVAEATYERREGKWFYQRHYGNYHGWDAGVWEDSMNIRLRWNFMEFNRL